MLAIWWHNTLVDNATNLAWDDIMLRNVFYNNVCVFIRMPFQCDPPDGFWRVPLWKNNFKVPYFNISLGVVRSLPWGSCGLAERRLPRIHESWVRSTIHIDGKIHFSQSTPFMKWNVKNCFVKLIFKLKLENKILKLKLPIIITNEGKNENINECIGNWWLI